MPQPHWVRWLKCSSEKTSGLGKFGCCGVHWGPIPWFFYTYALLCIFVNPHLVHMLLPVGSIACYFKSARFDFQRRKKEKLLPFSAPFSVSRGTIQGRHPWALSDATNSCLHLQHPTGYPGVTHCQNKEGHSGTQNKKTRVLNLRMIFEATWPSKLPHNFKVLYRNWCWNSQKGEPTDQWSVSWAQLRMGIEGHHMSSSNSRWIKDQLMWSKLFEKLISWHLNLAQGSISHAYAKTHVQRKKHAYVRVYIYIYKYANRYILYYIYTYIYKYVNIHIYIYVYICSSTHICLLVYIHNPE